MKQPCPVPVPHRHNITFTMLGAERPILTGEKTQTLRLASRRRDIRPGDTLQLCSWVGAPRRKGSYLEEIAEVTCTELAGPFAFHLHHDPCPVYTRRKRTLRFEQLPESEKKDLALRGGFESFEELVKVLRGFYGRRAAELVAIRWEAPR